jgi:predicted PurR-regulated permease PerM
VGLNLFGFFGLIFGPLLLSLFLLLVRVYMDEFGSNAAAGVAPAPPVAPPAPQNL